MTNWFEFWTLLSKAFGSNHWLIKTQWASVDWNHIYHKLGLHLTPDLSKYNGSMWIEIISILNLAGCNSFCSLLYASTLGNVNFSLPPSEAFICMVLNLIFVNIIYVNCQERKHISIMGITYLAYNVGGLLDLKFQ